MIKRLEVENDALTAFACCQKPRALQALPQGLLGKFLCDHAKGYGTQLELGLALLSSFTLP